MKKDQNSPETRVTLTLPKKKILRGTDAFAGLFRQSTTLRTQHLQFRYRNLPDIDSSSEAAGSFHSAPSALSISKKSSKIAFIAPKRLGNAVLRNRLKRQMREVFRKHQELFFQNQNVLHAGVHAIFIAQKAPLESEQIESEMITLLKQFRKRTGIDTQMSLSDHSH